MAFLNENSLSEDSRILLLAELLHVTDITKERLVERVYVEPNPALAQPSDQLRETRKKDAKSLFLIQSIMDEPSMGNSEARVFGGRSNHMYEMRSLFKELDEFQKIKVRLGDNKPLMVEGKGTIAIKTTQGLKLLGQKNMVVGIPKIDGPDFCKRRVYVKELTTPRTPEQNGVTERKNWTVVEMARTMMKEAKPPMKF
ncbi:hypothetical protein BC332_13352 [Capsicum chinense]|nr:hypothetical protein BC332_13352 [Capsicum chinense]